MMKRLYPCESYGVWNDKAKEFQFGIKVEKPEYAQKALVSKIGNDSKKWRFEIKSMNSVHHVNLHNKTQIEKQQQLIVNKQHELKSLLTELNAFETV